MAVEPMGPVVVGVGGSYSALRAVDLAAEESAARLTPLVVMHVQTQAEDADEILDVAAARALAAHPGLAVSTVAVAGDPARALISRSRDAYLLVLGHRRDPPFPALPAGPVTTRVVNEAGCPVMVHRPVDPGRTAPSPRPVLVGVDEHPRAEPVVGFAFEQAALRGAPVVAIHVRPWREPTAAEMLHEAVSAWTGKYPDVPFQLKLRYGRLAVPTLASASMDAQLVVVGSTRHGTPGPFARGLVTHAMVDLAGCPVAAVPLP